MASFLSCPVCYNGDIRTVADAVNLKKRFPQINRIMIGRGLLANPALAGKIHAYMEDASPSSRQAACDSSTPISSQPSLSSSNPTSSRASLSSSPTQELPSKKEIKAFLDDLWWSYSEELSGERDVLFKMKELWFHLGANYPEHKKALETIRKCKAADEYHRAVREILA